MSDDDGPAPASDGPDSNGRGAATAGGGQAARPAAPTTLRSVPSRPSEPLDLLALAGPGMAQRALPAALVVDLVLLALVRRSGVRWVLSAAGAGLVAVFVGSRRDQ